MDKPPSDPADHAEDFSRRYAEDLDIVAGQAMLDLGIPTEKIGARDHGRNSEHHGFFPGDGEGGTVSPAGQVTLDSGLMNPNLLGTTTRRPGRCGGEPGSGTGRRPSSPTSWRSMNTATTNWP